MEILETHEITLLEGYSVKPKRWFVPEAVRGMEMPNTVYPHLSNILRVAQTGLAGHPSDGRIELSIEGSGIKIWRVAGMAKLEAGGPGSPETPWQECNYASGRYENTIVTQCACQWCNFNGNPSVTYELNDDNEAQKAIIRWGFLNQSHDHAASARIIVLMTTARETGSLPGPANA